MTLGAHPRTARRLLLQLVEEEYVVCASGHRRRYEPTMRLVALAGQVLNNSALVRRARPYLALAHERTGTVAELVMPSYQSVVCVLRATTDGELIGPAVQHVSPAHRSAGGKVLLAWRDRWRESVLATPLDETIVDTQVLRDELVAARADGYADELGEGPQDKSSVAAPIVVGSEAVAALQVVGIAPGENCSYIARLVARTARELSDDLAGAQP